MIIDFFTGKEIKNDGKCNNCKYNVGYKCSDSRIIWCDKQLKYTENYNSCNDYKFRLEE